MKRLLTALSVAIAVLLSACAVSAPPPLPTQVADACWEHRIEIANTEGNLLLLCVVGSTASGTIHFTNLGGKPDLCRQQGSVKPASGGAFSLAFENGSCDSGGKFNAASFQCTPVDAASIRCTTHTVSTPLVFTRR